MFCAGRYFTPEVTPWQNIHLKSDASGNIFPVSTQIQAISNQIYFLNSLITQTVHETENTTDPLWAFVKVHLYILDEYFHDIDAVFKL